MKRGTLFLVVEYPADYASPLQGDALGVGYKRGRAMYPYFVSGDGDNWIKVSSQCRVLLEPILADRTSGAVLLGGVEKSSADIPLEKHGLYAAPNPFNPQTEIALYLKHADQGDVRIYDIRGRLVKELYVGRLAQGENRFVWDGRDSGGRGAASGPYWVQARTTGQDHTIKVMLLK